MKKRTIFLAIVSISVLALIIFSYSFLIINRNVKKNCLEAQRVYREDCLESLIKLIQSEDESFKKKNSAVWSLGQLADKKVLPFLYKLDNSISKQKKCAYNDYLCKYEVQKAIRWCEKGNITSWMYRDRENWR